MTTSTATRIWPFVGLGILFWFSAAMLIRFGGGTVFSLDGPYLYWVYALAVPVTGVFLAVTRVATRVPYGDLLRPIVVMTTTATFLDAVALTWFTSLYSTDYEVALCGAAWILWGAGLGLAFGYVLDQRASAAPRT